ncbi:MAG: TIR domain-containing protein [Acidobacteriia bacterium]|nr:TIR domain-containing protein [Terriglobia bacterium]
MNAPQRDQHQSIDFGVVTALEIERRAVCAGLGFGDNHRIKRGSRVYWKGTMPFSDGCSYEIVVAQAPDMANVDAALLTSDMIHDWQPEALLFAGIAGAAVSDVGLGDAVFGSSIYYYERGKVADTGFKPEPIMYKADATLWANATAIPEWKDPISCPRPDGTDQRPKIHYGVIASGEKVVADEAARDRIATGHRKILAIEMEGYGFSAAVWQSFHKQRHLVIRAVCDKADRNKSQDWQPYASAVAAGILRHFLSDRPLPCRSKVTAHVPEPAVNAAEQAVIGPLPARLAEKTLDRKAYRWDVFISYSHTDRGVAERVQEALEERGLRVWRDDAQIPPGASFAKTIEEALQESAAVAIMISPEAISSEWVLDEYYRALSLANRPKSTVLLIPVLVKDAALPGFLANRHWVDLRSEGDFEKGIQHLVAGIAGLNHGRRVTTGSVADITKKLAAIRFLWYFPEGLLKPIYEQLYVRFSAESGSPPAAVRVVTKDGIDLVQIDSEQLTELRRAIPDPTEEARRVFELLHECFQDEDPFDHTEELGLGRALLLRDLVRLIGFLRPTDQTELQGRDRIIDLARGLVDQLIQEHLFRIAFEINQDLVELSFAPDVHDYLRGGKLLLLIGDAERAADVFEVYRGDDLFGDEGLDDLHRVLFAIDWAKATKDAGRARKMHSELMAAYARMLELIVALKASGIDIKELEELEADVLHNRGTQAAVFGDEAEWTEAQNDFKTAAAKYKNRGNHVGVAGCWADFVAHSLDRSDDLPPAELKDLLHLLDSAGISDKAPPDEQVFFYFYQRGRLLKRLQHRDLAPALDAYLAAMRIAGNARLPNRSVLARGWVLDIQWQMRTISESAYLAGLDECATAMRTYPQDAWVSNSLGGVLVKMAELRAARSEASKAWLLAAEAAGIYLNRHYRSGSASSRERFVKLFRWLDHLPVAEDLRNAFVVEWNLQLRSVLSPSRLESLSWEQVRARMKAT